MKEQLDSSVSQEAASKVEMQQRIKKQMAQQRDEATAKSIAIKATLEASLKQVKSYCTVSLFHHVG